ncbi:MAG: hypothetical protein K8R23_01710 [Chthoniobacter sp.]|nr:hypothetical protein [Chthoniobacter sp.]
MNLDDALRCLFLRLLRADRVAAAVAGQSARGAALADLATRLAIAREKDSRSYRVVIGDSGREWMIPESDFVFYQRGDRKIGAEPSVSADDAQYEQNVTNARKWLAILVQAHES